MAALSSLELLRKRLPYDRRYAPLVENALQALQRGSALTERMLTFARRQELRLQPTQVASLVRNMHSFLQRSIGPTVCIDTQIPADLPPALTDGNQLETALLNLALNARDAMPDGGNVMISGRVAPASEGPPTLAPGDYVVIAVADSGTGMDAETVSRATEPFFSTKGVGKGTGLGLSMVHGTAVQSGGALFISSRRGEGTTVEIWLPLAIGLATADQPVQHEAAAIRQLIVLLVDDDPLVLTNTAALLEDLGHFVITAASAAEAVEAQRLHPDLDVVITDYAMPDMNGLELSKALHAQDPDLPIVLASGYADFVVVQEPRVSRLKKPFTQEQLQNFISEAVTPTAEHA
jgi:CheY-like chemotaxis protein